LPVDQLRLPHPDKSGFAITENVSPSPYPLPSRARGYKKNILLKEDGVSEESHLKEKEMRERLLIFGSTCT